MMGASQDHELARADLVRTARAGLARKGDNEGTTFRSTISVRSPLAHSRAAV
jgi:hypothetical protein